MKPVTAVTEKCFWLGERGMPYYFEDNDSLTLLEEKTLDTVDVGDVVVDGRGREYTISDTGQSKVVLFITKEETQYTLPVTREYLKRDSFTVKQDPPVPEVTEMSIEEAEAKLSEGGKQVKII